MISQKNITAVILLAWMAAGLHAQAISDMPVRLNSVGFVPELAKFATITAPEAMDDGVAFFVKRSAGGETVFEGVTGPSAYNGATAENLWIADFSAFSEEGEYFLDVPDIGRSARFRIANDAYAELYRLLMTGMYLWRCGSPTGVRATYDGETYSHAACHLSDGVIHSTGRNKDGAGGWHDAGDYNKYVVNSGVAVGMMLKAWEHFRPVIERVDLPQTPQSGSLPKFLSEVKWNLDWVAKMQFDDFTVSHKLTTINFGGMNTLPNTETATRYFTPYSTAATASFVAMLAQARRVYTEFDSTFARLVTNQAIRSYNYLQDNPGNVNMTGQWTTFMTGEYRTSSDRDDRLWAAAELWESTGQERFLRDFEERARGMGGSVVNIFFDWDNVQNLAAVTYALSGREGRDPELLQAVRDLIIAGADQIAGFGASNAHGRTFGSYYWGTNGIVARNTLLLYAARRLTGDAKYADAAQNALSYLLGRNYYGRSFVTGIGHNPPKNPHCRRSVATGKTWPGYLIGGPHNNKDECTATRTTDCTPPHRYSCSLAEPCWFDDIGDYWTNEIAINWNTAMIYAAAALLPESGLRGESPIGVTHRQTSRPGGARGITATRVVRVNGGRINIPPGAKVYGLDGRLVAHRRAGDANMPALKSSGVYIVKTDEKKKR